MFKTQKRRAAQLHGVFFDCLDCLSLLDQLELIDNPEAVGGNIFFKRLKR